MSKLKSVILLSAGLDSTVNLYMAMNDTEVIQTITFDYGQKAAKKEIEKAKSLSDHLKINHMVIDLPWFKKIGSSALTSDQHKIPTGKQVSITNLDVSKKTAQTVWVPNRNGVFLNIAAAVAEGLKAQIIVPGFNLEEAMTFPDNSFEFIRASRKSLAYSTQNHVDVQCYTVNLTKKEIVDKAKTLLVPFEKIWPCYFDYEKWCGECESCLRAKRAFRENHVDILGYFGQ